MPLELNVKNFAKINNQSILPFYKESGDGQQKVFRKLEIDSNSLAGETWEFPEIFSSLVFPGKTSYAVEYYEEDYRKLYTSIKFKTEYSGTKTQFTITLVDSFNNEKVWVVISRNTATSAAWITSWQNSYRQLHFISDNTSLRNWLKQIAREYKYEPFLYEPQFSDPAGYALSGVKDWTSGYLGIPDQHNNWNVVKINDNLFRNNKNIQKLTLPKALDWIGNNAFQGATFDEPGIVIPSTVREITTGAFKETNLKKIEFQEDTSTSNLTIGFQSFADNYFLNEITLPTRLNQIEQLAFSNDRALEKVFYKGQIEDWLKINFADETSNPLGYGAGLYINDNEFTTLFGSFKIPNYGFYGCGSLTEIMINQKEHHTVGTSAFANCPNLIRADLGTVESLDRTFENCHSLESFSCLGSVEVGPGSFKNTNLDSVWNIQDNVLSIGSQAFYGTALTGVYFTKLTGTLGSEAFAHNDNLKEINLMNTQISKIDRGAFRNCSVLEYVKLPNVSSFSTQVFYGNPILKEVWYNDTTENWMGATGAYKQFSNDSVKIICTDGYLTPIAGGSESYSKYGFYILKEINTEDDYIKNTEVAVTGHDFWRSSEDNPNSSYPTELTIPDTGDQKTFTPKVFINCSECKMDSITTGHIDVTLELENNYSEDDLMVDLCWYYYLKGSDKKNSGVFPCSFKREKSITFTLSNLNVNVLSEGYIGFGTSDTAAEDMAKEERYTVSSFKGDSLSLENFITYTVDRKITEISGYHNFGELSEVTLGTNIKKICSGTFQNCTKLGKIKYKGIQAQWRSIIKEDGWYDSDQEIEIVCDALE